MMNNSICDYLSFWLKIRDIWTLSRILPVSVVIWSWERTAKLLPSIANIVATIPVTFAVA